MKVLDGRRVVSNSGIGNMSEIVERPERAKIDEHSMDSNV